TAHEKFEAWNAEHELLVAKREESHRKAKAEKRQADEGESVRLVEEKIAAKEAELAAAKAQAEAEAAAAESENAAGVENAQAPEEQQAEAGENPEEGQAETPASE